jgi:hypothetical protein
MSNMIFSFGFIGTKNNRIIFENLSMKFFSHSISEFSTAKDVANMQSSRKHRIGNDTKKRHAQF